MLGKLLISTLGGLASAAVDAAAHKQTAPTEEPQQGGGRRRRSRPKKKECTPCMARGMVVEAQADAREHRKRVSSGDFG